MSILRENCPIPFYQQPYNEYKILRNTGFFSWPTLSSQDFLSKVLMFWLIVSILLLPIVTNIFSMPLKFEKLIISDLIFSSLILVLFLTRLYLGWSYIMQRLLSATVFYEESGWYDGQMWIKPAEMLTQDRLIGTYEVMPLLIILRKFLIIIVFLLLSITIIYFFI
uniref:Ycf36 n=1 Tax=Hildenbrandia rubra TaxID=31481 RepID=A0A1C9CFW8_9FLOR|nr:hypothetical protein Hrub_018 [Hildenbrandia rubra]AOM67262.1 hypothetical protein Hrub_018 [Hildenbrandia rubra]